MPSRKPEVTKADQDGFVFFVADPGFRRRAGLPLIQVAAFFSNLLVFSVPSAPSAVDIEGP